MAVGQNAQAAGPAQEATPASTPATYLAQERIEGLGFILVLYQARRSAEVPAVGLCTAGGGGAQAKPGTLLTQWLLLQAPPCCAH